MKLFFTFSFGIPGAILFLISICGIIGCLIGYHESPIDVLKQLYAKGLLRSGLLFLLSIVVLFLAYLIFTYSK